MTTSNLAIWNTQKTVSLTGHSRHRHAPSPLAMGFQAPPPATHISFGPTALAAAIARTATLRDAPPELLSRLKDRALNDAEILIADGPVFALSPYLASLADTERTHFAARMGAGITDLYMNALGYVWRDNAACLASTLDPHADFLYAGGSVSGHGVVLAEARGSFAAGITDAKVAAQARSKYLRQVRPYIAKPSPHGDVIHGYSLAFGSKPGTTGAFLRLSETQRPKSPRSPPPQPPLVAGRATPTQIALSSHRSNFILMDALTGDSTFMELQSDTGLMAAEAVAEWLATDPDQPTVVIVPDGDSGLLDQMLAARGLPALGLSHPSPFRGALQVLSLAFSIAWRPLDPRKLIELLILPRPPMRRWAAGMLASALAREPGIGGESWQMAWERIEERLRAEAGEEANEDEIQNILLQWQQWTDGGRFHPDDGIPRDEAVSICRRVGQWAVGLDAGKQDPLLMAVLSAARALAEAIETLNNETFSPLLIERMIDQAIADGTPDPEAEPKAGNLRGVMKPAAIWSPAPRIIWWDFVGPGERPAHSPWTEEETASLHAAGCAPEPIDIAASRIASAWQQGVLNAQEQLILVRPAHDAGTQPVTHPLLHRLDPLLNGLGPKYVARAEDLLSKEKVQIAQRAIPRRRLNIASLPIPIPAWALPASIANRLDTRRESATSLEILVSCQLRWILQHVIGLPSGSLREIPEARQLFGNVAHELSNRVFAGEPDPEQVRAVTTETIDEVIENIASPLLQAGVSQEIAFAKERIPAALAELAKILRDKGLSVSETELSLEADFDDGLKVSSRLDMLAHDGAGDPQIIDLKWSGTANYRRDEIAEGRAIQLATYSRLVIPAGGVPAGYYMLNQRQLLAESGSPIATVPVETTRNLDETWRALVETWTAWSNLARADQAVATGVEGAEALVPSEVGIEPENNPCRFCDFQRLCRIGSLDR